MQRCIGSRRDHRRSGRVLGLATRSPSKADLGDKTAEQRSTCSKPSWRCSKTSPRPRHPTGVPRQIDQSGFVRQLLSAPKCAKGTRPTRG